MKKTQPIYIISTVIAILAPLSYVFYWIIKAGELSTFDYWGIIAQFYSVDGFSTNPLDWLVRSNEHFILIPTIIYAINILITKGSNLGLSLITLGFAGIQILLLVALIPPSLKQSRLVFLLLLLCISIFSFTPAGAHNWMRGFSGVVWVGSNMFAIAAIFCLTKLVEHQQLKWAISSIICAILGYLTYSSSLALLPVLCIAAVLMRLPRRFVLLYVGFAVLISCTFLMTYKTPVYHPELSNLSLGKAITYIPVYLGAIFTTTVKDALLIGTIGLVAATGFARYWLSTKANSVKTAGLPWLAIQTYVVINAILAAISRSGLGIEQAKESRYASLPSLFWLSSIALALLWLQQLHANNTRNHRRHRLLVRAFFAIVTVLILLTYSVGSESARAIAQKAVLHPLVVLSVQLDAPDINLVREAITPAPEQFLGLLDALKANRLLPFDRDIKQDNFCTALDRKIDSHLLTATPQDSAPGFFARLNRLTFKVAQVEGWVNDNREDIKCIAILNQDNVSRGFAMTGFQRLDAVRASDSFDEFSGWKGYVNILPTDRQLTAYALFKHRKDWVALHQPYKL